MLQQFSNEKQKHLNFFSSFTRLNSLTHQFFVFFLVLLPILAVNNIYLPTQKKKCKTDNS